ncbi:hypothetical protein SBA2_280028 [Acidobacteriia bacterium SbA2]|nr:hypothetical protein SBA2_280028 [Acidobacteriia bacterium SbA2]
MAGNKDSDESQVGRKKAGSVAAID